MLKVVDFGFSKLMQGTQVLRTPCYTEQYAAPEVLDDDPQYDESCDMWSVGVILYTMLCGYAPFRVQGRSSSSLYRAVQSELKFPHKEWGMISPAARDLVTRLLDVNPTHRLSPKVWSLGPLCGEQHSSLRSFARPCTIGGAGACVDAARECRRGQRAAGDRGRPIWAPQCGPQHCYVQQDQAQGRARSRRGIEPGQAPQMQEHGLGRLTPLGVVRPQVCGARR